MSASIQSVAALFLFGLLGIARAAETPAPEPAREPASTATAAPAPAYDPALAARTGADERGMRPYVLVILKSSSTPVPKGEARDAMFRGHFANMERLAAEGKLVLAGPLDGVDGWRGLFVLAVDDIEAARALVATDPVVAEGEMVPEFHKYYGTAALMLINELHAKLQKPAG
jgi:uncharacterized protein YciI